jgi:hypothetical protein
MSWSLISRHKGVNTFTLANTRERQRKDVEILQQPERYNRRLYHRAKNIRGANLRAAKNAHAHATRTLMRSTHRQRRTRISGVRKFVGKSGIIRTNDFYRSASISARDMRLCVMPPSATLSRHCISTRSILLYREKEESIDLVLVGRWSAAENVIPTAAAAVTRFRA